MSRQPRYKSCACFFHVMAQGNERAPIFKIKSDILHFLKNMKNVLNEYEVDVIAYCIMPNHYHMLVNTKDVENMTNFFHRINTGYAVYYNKKYGRVGHVFRDRFKSQEILDEKYYRTCLKYIYYNPVKAKICDNPVLYEYSNIKEYMKKNKEFDDFNIEFKYSFCDIEEEKLKCKEVVTEFLKQNNIDKKYLIMEKEKIQELIKVLKDNHGFSFKEISDEIGIGRERVRVIYSQK